MPPKSAHKILLYVFYELSKQLSANKSLIYLNSKEFHHFQLAADFFLIQTRSFWLTVWTYLKYFGSFYNMNK